MSYILNALRKSEQERQALQPDTVAARIAVQPAPARQGIAKIVVALVLLNAAILTYFLGFAPGKPEAVQPIAANRAPRPDAQSEPVPDGQTGKPERKRPSAPKADPPPRTVAASSVADKAGAAKKMAPEPPKVTAAPKPVVVAEPAREDSAPEPEAPAVPAPKPAVPAVAAVAAIAPAAAPPRPKSGLDTLDDLPPELRQSLPSLPINVYSYSATPAERFVMIDMVKYVPGQTIKDQVELREIQEDGIVVRYRERVFKIKR